MNPECNSPKRERFVESNFYDRDLFLMVDDRLIAECDGARWEFCPLEKASSPVLVPSPRCEGGDGTKPRPVHQDPLEGSILWDAEQERYVAWYRTHCRSLRPSTYRSIHGGASIPNRGRQGSNYCMATSKDGIHWERPELGAVLFENSYRNNLIPDCPGPVLKEHISGVVKNYLDDGKPELIATTYSTYDDAIYPYGITHMHSPDGVRWSPHFPPPLPLDGDAHCLMWDPKSRSYLCTTRSAQHDRIFQRLRDRGYKDLATKRHTALARSRDLIHWTPMMDILEADSDDPPNAQIYTMYILPYGNLYLGFIEMFYVAEGWSRGPLDYQLAISYDLEHWYRAGKRQPVLARGPSGSWDSAHVHLFASTPFPEGDRLRFWYGGKDEEHWQGGNAAIGTATLRRDGFACWSAGPEGGTITTIPLELYWAVWPTLNVDAENGEVRLEILTEDGEPIEGCTAAECLPITGNHLEAEVKYGQRRGNFIRHSGRVRFRFHLRNAKLYAFRAPNVTIANSGNTGGESNLWL